jgi:predicted alpha/beta-hydrolase family hydrolase
MMIALPPAQWAAFAAWDATALAEALREVARYVQPAKYRKARRGPKKPPPPKGKYNNGGHVSTHKLLQNSRK